MSRFSSRTHRRVVFVLDVGPDDVSDDRLTGYLTDAVNGWSGQLDADDPMRQIKVVSIESVRHANKPRRSVCVCFNGPSTLNPDARICDDCKLPFPDLDDDVVPHDFHPDPGPRDFGEGD